MEIKNGQKLILPAVFIESTYYSQMKFMHMSNQ